jgi:ABC-type glycerol-3-phosphate transport system substrate-binding protein
MMAVQQSGSNHPIGGRKTMKVYKMVLMFILSTLILLAVAGCGTEPLLMSDIPVYPGAESMARGQNEMADSLADVIKESSGGEGVDVEIDLYSLPPDTTWEDIKGYYNGEIADTDWQVEAELGNESEVFSTIGWSRGGGASEQALIVGYVADIIGGDAFMIVGLFSE